MIKRWLAIGLLFHLSIGHLQPLFITDTLNTNWKYGLATEYNSLKDAILPLTVLNQLTHYMDYSNIEHPYYGNTESIYQWIADSGWVFQTEFSLRKELLSNDFSCELQLNGIDLFADVYVNDIKATSCNNAFKSYKENIQPFLNQSKSNQSLKIIFHPIRKRLQELAKIYGELPGGIRVYGRKPQYEFGWDWGPTLINVGIRKPICIVYKPPHYVELTDIHITTMKISKKRAVLSTCIEVYSSHKDSIKVIYPHQFTVPYLQDSREITVAVKEGKNIFSMQTIIENPILWFPGRSMNQIYRLGYVVYLHDKVVYWKTIPYGICDIKLIQQPDSKGKSFYFTANGEKVYCKGANYIPSDAVSPGLYETELIKLAKEANMNMIRVWGGGSYPDDSFYEECLYNGIMVWQDFMFGCAMYPGDSSFLKNVQEEAFYQAQRLKNYNNIAIWCGNNENDEGWKNWGWQKEFNYSSTDSARIWGEYLQLFESILPAAVKQHDPETDYISSSPMFGWGKKESMTSGDSHYWGVWWGLEPIEKYSEKVPRFMSEFGMQAMPDMGLLQSVIPDTAMYFNSQMFKNHQKHPTGFQTLNHYLLEYFSVPNTMIEYSYATQILQAYALQTAIENQRTMMPYCMGTLLWQLNDCWPVTSWSIIDYALNKKIGYEQVKKSFMPVIITMKETANGYDMCVVNDGQQPIRDALQMYISDFDGNKYQEWKFKINVKENTSLKITSISKDMVEKIGAEKLYLHAELNGDMNTGNNFHFVKPNQLKLDLPTFSILKDQEGQFYLQANTYCPYAWLPGNPDQPALYLEDLEPNKPFYFTDKDSMHIKYMEKNLTQILCLNKILVQH